MLATYDHGWIIKYIHDTLAKIKMYIRDKHNHKMGRQMNIGNDKADSIDSNVLFAHS